MPLVRLNGTYGYGRPRHYYGPGLVDVPEGLARALGLTPIPEVVAPSSEPAEATVTEAPALPESGGASSSVKRGRKPRASEE